MVDTASAVFFRFPSLRRSSVRRREAATQSDRPFRPGRDLPLRLDAWGCPHLRLGAALSASAMLKARDAHRRRPGSFDWRRTPGPRCAAPSEAALPALYASPPRRCPVPSGRGSWGCSGSRRPTGSITAAAAGCRCASARNAIAGTSTARGSAPSSLAGSRCAAPVPATNAAPVEPADMLNDNGAIGSGGGKM